ncbi:MULTISPECIES: hypothetical protein [Pseudomonas]|nr:MULTISPECIES: hypothetical protein [Pseudomonas]MCX9135598.1 hypothetical protein [Pseudomonas sp. DCB_PUT]MDD1969591.1 hypothetical protein [Pseudomonas putida]MDO1464821.1 hypothetical protein [Pseudomonas putida]MDO1470191.1 hypothetical protein [Pseudomonas putida]MDZ7325899.1 hypothetical protein [Pseudomonas sp. SDS3-8]
MASDDSGVDLLRELLQAVTVVLNFLGHPLEHAAMTPEQIRAFIEREYSHLVAEPRHNPDGWAFFLGAPRRGADSNRIFRAVQHSGGGPTRLKLAVTSRLKGEPVEIDFTGSEAALKELIDRELQRYSDGL